MLRIMQQREMEAHNFLEEGALFVGLKAKPPCYFLALWHRILYKVKAFSTVFRRHSFLPLRPPRLWRNLGLGGRLGFDSEPSGIAGSLAQQQEGPLVQQIICIRAETHKIPSRDQSKPAACIWLNLRESLIRISPYDLTLCSAFGQYNMDRTLYLLIALNSTLQPQDWSRTKPVRGKVLSREASSIYLKRRLEIKEFGVTFVMVSGRLQQQSVGQYSNLWGNIAGSKVLEPYYQNCCSGKPNLKLCRTLFLGQFMSRSILVRKYNRSRFYIPKVSRLDRKQIGQKKFRKGALKNWLETIDDLLSQQQNQFYGLNPDCRSATTADVTRKWKVGTPNASNSESYAP
ncbi:hypothetical protein VNO77_02435 [Canavalia gladiata]|uniref:Uncharacterized protein n=1 Tax=Canavalia gladiata TaxID=3824 RepID=A0AAN9MYA3_CANGL